VSDPSGASSVRAFDVVVNNVAPQVGSAGDAGTVAGMPYLIRLDYGDVGDDSVQSWLIDWGDGDSSTVAGGERAASHVYRTPGAMLITVRAQDDDGLWAAAPRALQVTAAVPPPLALSAAERLRAGRVESPGVTRVSVDNSAIEWPAAPAAQPAVGLVTQTPHLASQILGFLVAGEPGTAAAPGALTREQFAALFEADAPPPASGPLQVSTVIVSGGGLRVRFNQVIDLTRLGGAGGGGVHEAGSLFVLVRGSDAVPGALVVDPDGRGVLFIPGGGPLADGVYTLRLSSGASGWATPTGNALDGDRDGRAGGDYLARFTIAGGALRVAAAEDADDAATALAADWTAQQLARGDGIDPALWTALTGGIGGLISLAFAPLARPRPVRRGRRTVPADDEVRVRFDAAAARPAEAPTADSARAVTAPIAAPSVAKPSWMSRWLGGSGVAQNWRIRL
jgi:hypothetical protein